MYRHHAQTLGRIRMVRGSFSFTMTRPNDVRLEPMPGAGSLWDLGCYPVSYIRLVMGEEPKEAFGWQDPDPGTPWLGKSGGDPRCPRGAIAQFDCSFRAPLRAELEIVGSEATLRVPEPFKPGLTSVLELRREGKPPETIEVAGGPVYAGEVENMADVIHGGRPQRVTLADSRGNCAALVALLESARTGRVVGIG